MFLKAAAFRRELCQQHLINLDVLKNIQEGPSPTALPPKTWQYSGRNFVHSISSPTLMYMQVISEELRTQHLLPNLDVLEDIQEEPLPTAPLDAGFFNTSNSMIVSFTIIKKEAIHWRINYLCLVCGTLKILKFCARVNIWHLKSRSKPP